MNCWIPVTWTLEKGEGAGEREMFLYRPLATEPSNLSKALSNLSQLWEGFGIVLQAGLGEICIVHIIAGILCFLNNSQQEIPATNLSTFFFFNKIFRGKKERRAREWNQAVQNKEGNIKLKSQLCKILSLLCDFIFSSEGFMTSRVLFLWHQMVLPWEPFYCQKQKNFEEFLSSTGHRVQRIKKLFLSRW